MKLMFWKKDPPPVQTEEQKRLGIQKMFAAYRTLLRISKRMKERPARVKAEERRRRRAAKRADPVKRKHMGEVDDAEFGAKPDFYAKKVLYKDGNGNHVKEIL